MPADEHLLERAFAAVVHGKLTAAAAAHLRRWLTAPGYEEYRPALAELIHAGAWDEIEAAFWTIIPFGTAGRRGRMHPFGSATINDRTIGESAQALAGYVVELHGRGEAGALRCAIAYDTRHRSRPFAELCAEIMAAAGFEVLFFDGCRATPELAFTVRDKKCACGIMISASHNPPSDNAIKVFWSTGGQINAPHDAELVERIGHVGKLGRMPFAEASATRRVRYCQAEMDGRYREVVLRQGHHGPRALKILYSPLHGVGATSVLPVLTAAGFRDVELFAPHAAPDGDFSNVPGHVANPENPQVFDALIRRAEQSGADLILASDPDADRIGAAARLTRGGPWRTLNGNQIGALLADYLLQRRLEAGRLKPDDFVVTTIVSTDMLRRVADGYGVRAADDLYTGFKWIGEKIDELGPDRFVFGFEEAHGYLAGDYIRDKDGAVAALLLAELAALCASEGRTLHEQLERLYLRIGRHLEKTAPLTMPGADGMLRMQEIMRRFRTETPKTLGGLRVEEVRDYATCTDRAPSDLLVFRLEGGNRAAVRPSGTEPKIKFYLFTMEPPERSKDAEAAKRILEERLARLEADFLKFAT